MTQSQFPHLLSPIKLGKVELRNRIIFPAHETLLQSDDGLLNDAYIAYQVARTRAGAGLNILTAASIDDFSFTQPSQPRLDSDETIPGYRAMADAIHAEGGKVFAQLLHAGREMYSAADGSAPLTFSSSDTYAERFHIRPRALTISEIRKIVEAYGAAAARAVEAGVDGIEICGNQGNLPAQFLAATINSRTDEYGGSLANRCRFILEVAQSVRSTIGPDIAFGFRLSAADLDNDGLEEEESLEALARLDASGLVDYLHIVLGTPSTRAGAMHIVAPMEAAETGYVVPFAERAKKRLKLPLVATGRFNTPQSAELAIANGFMDAAGMTRAMICDPRFVSKVREGRIDDIRACIACDQACIGHFQRGYSVSCIQFPESGRELTLGAYGKADRAKKVIVAGGGPAGMKAASVAAMRGHHVILCEASGQLGGQAILASKVSGRAEFGGIVTNLAREVELAGVTVRLKQKVTKELIESEGADAVVLATGSTPRLPSPERIEGIKHVTAHDVIAGTAKVGQSVLIADITCDWAGVGAALQLSQNGHDVTIAVVGIQPGETMPTYVRDKSAARLFEAGVKIINYARLYGADGNTVYLEHVAALKPIVVEGVDTLVICHGGEADRRLEREIEGLPIERHIVGDCLTPRTAEEAVLEGLKAAIAL
ncbi:oxidoreductase [Mesorhizobium sp. CU2]|uniref:oxidoreductase n=1 Tax=unclassified Mesorhizobium TaxID=325217 RepID=UPI001128BBFE|nr:MULTISPECIES: FAD-dependent oxidoreductase [unclassified Mesorhizobium]TPN81113.1 oxidoreductase [Mesorhizobium sp. CU3]TPO17089.1 oxidoreductase [Mesorhizobium sp. CU2]